MKAKASIHPAQIDVINEAFRPSAKAIEDAQNLVKAFEEAKENGKLAFEYGKVMVGPPHLKSALDLLDRAE